MQALGKQQKRSYSSVLTRVSGESSAWYTDQGRIISIYYDFSPVCVCLCVPMCNMKLKTQSLVIVSNPFRKVQEPI